MRIDSLKVTIQSATAEAITFRFDTTARLDATDEASVKWGLWVDLYGIGTTTLGGYVVPDVASDHRYVGDPTQPTSKKQGDSWAPSFTQTYQRNAFTVRNNDKYVFYAKLVPVTAINPSAQVATTLAQDL